MSPLKIRIMLHYHCHTDDFVTNGSKGEMGAVEELIAAGMIEHNRQEGSEAIFQISDKGHTYVKAIMSIKEPVCSWKVDFSAAMEG